MKYEFIGWCSDGVHDKVWVCIHLSGGRMGQEPYDWGHPGKYLTVWGRRGKKLQHKVVEAIDYDMGNIIYSKRNKGYKEVNKAELDRVYPEFQEDLEKTTAWALLKV